MDAEHDIDTDPPVPPRDRDDVVDDDIRRPDGKPLTTDSDAADDRPPDHGDRPEAAADAPDEVRLGDALDPRLTEAE